MFFITLISLESLSFIIIFLPIHMSLPLLEYKFHRSRNLIPFIFPEPIKKTNSAWNMSHTLDVQ